MRAVSGLGQEVLALVVVCLALVAPAARAAPPGSPWGESYFPNVELVTQDGRKVRFYDDLIRDQRVVVSFVYTSCTKVCGLITANLARVHRELGERARDVHFYSITLDPERDTPEVLRKYAASFRTGPGWTFLTGSKADIQLLRKKFGDLVPVEEHAPTLRVGNDALGLWWSTTALDDPTYLATLIGGWMDPSWDGSALVASHGYAKAPRIPVMGRGQETYRQKCAACHLDDGASVGPSLAGAVERRGEKWLHRWLEAPDKLIRAKDPVALELLARHGNVAMPNLGLSGAEVTELIQYLKASDAARATVARGRAP